MKATLLSSSISANLGNSGEAMVEIHKYSVKLWLPHFRTFCELVEGEENKLTTFSTWTIMLGCNESNIIFQQYLCKLGQLWRSNGRNSQVFGQAMKKRPTGQYKKYSHFKGRDTAPTTSSREGSCIIYGLYTIYGGTALNMLKAFSHPKYHSFNL